MTVLKLHLSAVHSLIIRPRILYLNRECKVASFAQCWKNLDEDATRLISCILRNELRVVRKDLQDHTDQQLSGRYCAEMWYFSVGGTNIWTSSARCFNGTVVWEKQNNIVSQRTTVNEVCVGRWPTGLISRQFVMTTTQLSNQFPLATLETTECVRTSRVSRINSTRCHRCLVVFRHACLRCYIIVPCRNFIKHLYILCFLMLSQNALPLTLQAKNGNLTPSVVVIVL